MPSPLHDTLAELAIEKSDTLMARATAPLNVRAQSFRPVDPVLRPATLAEVRPDGLLESISESGDGDKTYVIIEVQLQPDEDKAARWAWYLSLTEALYKARAVLVVVAPNEDVSVWARKVIANSPTLDRRSVVLSANDVARFDHLPPEQRTVTAALWSVAMHVKSMADLPLLKAALEMNLMWQEQFDSWRDYTDTVVRLLPPWMAEELRRATMADTAILQPELTSITAYWEQVFGERGRQEGRREGRQEGRRVAELQASRRFFEKLLRVRGLSPSEEQMRIINACMEPEVFEAWQDRLLDGATLDQCFSETARVRG